MIFLFIEADKLQKMIHVSNRLTLYNADLKLHAGIII